MDAPLLGSPTMSPVRSPDSGGLGGVDEGDLPFRKRVSDLMDFTEEFKKKGIYGEYLQYKTGYMKWRKGEASGAKGEPTAQEFAKQAEENDFEFWYPTVQTFKFRRTISFWTGILQIEGCLLFLWVPFFEEFAGANDELRYFLTKLPALAGGTVFLIGIYFGYIELINLDSAVDTERLNYLWCNWRQLLRLHIEIWSIIGSFVYLAGALLYSVAQIADLFTLDADQRGRLVDWPLILGGFLFFIGGICELLINKVFCTAPVRFVWWISVLNCIGGFTFWVSAVPSLMKDGETATIVGVVGDVAYLLGGALAIKMWQGEQFGGAIIPVLNTTHRHSEDPETSLMVRYSAQTGIYHIVKDTKNLQGDEKSLGTVLNPKLSWRGMLFLFCYVSTSVAQTLACCASLHYCVAAWTESETFHRMINSFVYSVSMLFITRMVLVLQSACVHMPKKEDEPYRTLYKLMRSLSVVILANSVLTLKVLFEIESELR